MRDRKFENIDQGAEILKGMTFDQLERYRSAALVINLLREINSKTELKILDLGGYFQSLTGEIQLPMPLLFPGLNCTVADVPDCNLSLYTKLIPDKPLPFRDNQFNVTVSMDVLEHIPPQGRLEFVSEALRVTCDVLVLAAPFQHVEREAADRWLAEFYSQAMNASNSMLDEHLENGLPIKENIENYLKKTGCQFLSFQNGDLAAWRQVMAVKHLIQFTEGPQKTIEFETELFPWADSVAIEGPGYRDVYVIIKNKSQDYNLSLFQNRIAEAKRLIRNNRKKNTANSIEVICSRYLTDIGISLNKHQKSIADYREQSFDQKLAIAKLKRQITALRHQINHKNHQKNLIQFNLNEKERMIYQLLEEKASMEEKFLNHVSEYEKGLTELKGSAAYKTGKILLAPIKKTVDLIQSTRKKEALTTSEEQSQPTTAKEGQVIHEEDERGTGYHSDETPKEGQVINFNHNLTFSILVPVYNTNPEILTRMIESVLNQTYQKWELCMVDDASPQNEPRQIIQDYARKWPGKIQFKFQENNRGIAVTTQEAAALANGDFICLLDHDDLLHEDALMEVAEKLEIDPDTDYLYSDENKVSYDGKTFSQPYFKPDFDPELLLCNNYLNHFSVIRKSLFDQVGGYREGFDGSQDYDLFLRVTEKARKIVHIPKILYHWRMIPESTAVDAAAKGGLFRESTVKALESAMKRRQCEATVTKGIHPGSYRVKFNVKNSGKVSIIIPTRNAVELVDQCVSTIETYTEYPDYEIIIVDNGSDEDLTLEYFSRKSSSNPRFKCLSYNHRFNFSEINNFAVKHTDSKYLLFLNNDIEITHKGWLKAMLEYGQQEGVGAVGAKLLYPDQTIQHAGVIVGQGGIAGHCFKEFPEFTDTYFGHANLVKNYSAVTGACLLVPRDVFDDVGGFNEELAVAFNDIDLCLEIRRRGYRIVYTPYARLIHHESVSRLDDNDDQRRPRFHGEITYMISKWGQVIYSDPYLNPNLSLLKTDMSIKEPGEDKAIEQFRNAFRGFFPGM